MDQKQNALRGYGQTKRQTASDKHIELQLFSSITARLRAEANKNPAKLTSELAETLVENAKLWNILFCDLVAPENKLALDLKTNLISLAEFTQSHTQRILRGEASLAILIEINTAIIEGLKTAIQGPEKESETVREVA